MSDRRENAVKLRVGVFVLLALATFLGLIYALGARARLFESRYTVHADFTEVGGLVEGATVRLAGVQIGRVTAVTLPGQPGGKVRVDLTIARRFSDRIRKNSVARIETQGLLGDRIVEITVGDTTAPPLAPGEVLVSRDPADFSRIISSGAETAKNKGPIDSASSHGTHKAGWAVAGSSIARTPIGSVSAASARTAIWMQAWMRGRTRPSASA